MRTNWSAHADLLSGDWRALDAQAAAGHQADANWRGQKSDIQEGGHRVPFIASWPGHIAPDSISNQLICHTDLFATVAELTGAKLTAAMAEGRTIAGVVDLHFKRRILEVEIEAERGVLLCTRRHVASAETTAKFHFARQGRSLCTAVTVSEARKRVEIEGDVQISQIAEAREISLIEEVHDPISDLLEDQIQVQNNWQRSVRSLIDSYMLSIECLKQKKRLQLLEVY
mgnify:CR=1 FL=1